MHSQLHGSDRKMSVIGRAKRVGSSSAASAATGYLARMGPALMRKGMGAVQGARRVVPLVDASALPNGERLRIDEFQEDDTVRGDVSKLRTVKRLAVSQEVEATRRRVDELYTPADLYVNFHSKTVPLRNAVRLVILLYTAALTPFEVAYLDTSVVGVRFVWNRIIDLVFLGDFFTNLVTPYKNPGSGKYVRDPWLIFVRYAQSRLLLDMAASAGVLAFDLFALSAPAPNMLEIGRLLRFVHLADLPPLLSGLSRTLNIVGEDKWSYNKLSLVTFLVTILTLVHWMACVWRLVVKFEEQSDSRGDTWIAHERMLDAGPSELYVVCLYWAGTTITTIGYGDKANPTTELERMVALFTMLLGALVWARIIGGITSIVSAFNVDDLEFSEQIDRLNVYMDSKDMPLDLRDRLRQYFRQRKQMDSDHQYSALMERMSPALRGEVARSVNREWLERVPWLNNGSLGFIASLAIALELELFAPQELIIGGQLRVLTRGVVARNAKIMTSGCVWGIDMMCVLLSSPSSFLSFTPSFFRLDMHNLNN